MSTEFILQPLPRQWFESLFALDEEQLRRRSARRVVADGPGYPCRVSLADAEAGESLILAEFTHHPVSSPYRASGPVFVRENAITAKPGVNEIPAMLKTRLLSIRAYSADAQMVSASLIDGTDLAVAIDGLFEDPEVDYLHVHNARQGCYLALVERI